MVSFSIETTESKKNNMSYYKYDPVNLIYVKVNRFKLFTKLLIIPSTFFLVSWINYHHTNDGVVKMLTPEERVIIINESVKFSEEKLISEIKRLNFRFPHIVLAQAQIESGHFKSRIFKENNNLFGMREARVRANLAIGTKRNHAYYHTWKESLYDYALYYSEYLSDLKTEDQYYQYINESYAEDPNYGVVVKSKSEKNKKLFE